MVVTIGPHPLTSYRNRIITASLMARLVVGSGVIMILFVLGFGQVALDTAFPDTLVSIAYLLVLLTLTYTFYALLRSFVYSDPPK